MSEPRTSVSTALINATMLYLAEQPYKQVAGLLTGFQNEARPCQCGTVESEAVPQSENDSP